MSAFCAMLWQPFYTLLTNNRRPFVSPHTETMHSQYNALHHLTCYKQKCFKDIQIHTIFGTHEDSFKENIGVVELKMIL